MNEKIAKAMRTEADCIRDMHERGFSDAHKPITAYQLWCSLTNIAADIEGSPEPCNRWSMHEFKPKEAI